MTLPESMQYVDLPTPGGPEAMRLASGPLPAPKPGEVLIRVRAAGVNGPDLAQRRGVYPPPPGASPILGLEVAGEVAALGEGAALSVGDRVCALTNGGGYAEYCTTPATQCLPWPKGYDAVRAAALPETFFTVWANLFETGGLKEGQSALVHGGSSGIGTVAIQLARAFGAKIYVTAGSAEKCAACEKLGATAAINYREADFAESIKTLTGGAGVNVVLDMVGGPYLQQNLRCLAPGGMLVVIAVLGGPKADTIDLARVMARRLTITGSTLRPRSPAQKQALAEALHAKVWPLLEDGRCAPVIYKSFPLAEVAEAHRLMESSRHIGKIMLTV